MPGLRTATTLAALGLAAALGACKDPRERSSDDLYGQERHEWERSVDPVPAGLIGTWRREDADPGELETWRIYRDDGAYKILDEQMFPRSEGEYRILADIVLHHRLLESGEDRPSRTLIRYAWSVAGDRLELHFRGPDGQVVRTLRFRKVADLAEGPNSGWTNSRD